MSVKMVEETKTTSTVFITPPFYNCESFLYSKKQVNAMRIILNVRNV